jgi:hypothetical protein
MGSASGGSIAPIGLTIDKTSTLAGEMVQLNHGSAASGVVLDINATNASFAGNVIDVLNSGNGDALRIQNSSTATNSQGIHIINSGAASALFIDNDVSEFGLNIQQNGASTAINIDKSNTDGGNCINIDNSGTASMLLLKQHGAGFCVSIDQNAAATAVNIDKTNVGAGNCLRLNNSGTGDALEINQTGGGIAIMIASDATADPLIDLTPITSNSRGDIAFGVTRTADPSSPSVGDIWFNATDALPKVHDGTDNLPMAFTGVKGVLLASKVVDPPLQGSPYGPITETVTVTGAAPGDVAIVTPDSALEEDVFWVVRGITTDLVTVELVDLKGVAVDIPAHTIHIMVFDLT